MSGISSVQKAKVEIIQYLPGRFEELRYISSLRTFSRTKHAPCALRDSVFESDCVERGLGTNSLT